MVQLDTASAEKRLNYRRTLGEFTEEVEIVGEDFSDMVPALIELIEAADRRNQAPQPIMPSH